MNRGNGGRTEGKRNGLVAFVLVVVVQGVSIPVVVVVVFVIFLSP